MAIARVSCAVPHRRLAQTRHWPQRKQSTSQPTLQRLLQKQRPPRHWHLQPPAKLPELLWRLQQHCWPCQAVQRPRVHLFPIALCPPAEHWPTLLR